MVTSIVKYVLKTQNKNMLVLNTKFDKFLHQTYENNYLDQRPDIAPSHWDGHFKIYYLTEKMRSQNDKEFSEKCDRVGNGTYKNDDLRYLKQCVFLY